MAVQTSRSQDLPATGYEFVNTCSDPLDGLSACPLPLKTKETHEVQTYIHAPSAFGTRDPSVSSGRHLGPGGRCYQS
jgi:hypothetical protein